MQCVAQKFYKTVRKKPDIMILKYKVPKKNEIFRVFLTLTKVNKLIFLKEVCLKRRVSNCEILQNFRCQTHKQHEKRGRREETNSATLWRGPRIFNSAHRNVCCSCICYLFFMHTVVFYYCVAEISLPETRHLCHFV